MEYEWLREESKRILIERTQLSLLFCAEGRGNKERDGGEIIYEVELN